MNLFYHKDGLNTTKEASSLYRLILQILRKFDKIILDFGGKV